MIKKLPNWYHVASIAPLPEETFKKRSNVIETIASSENKAFLFDCIRYYLGKPTVERDFKQMLGKHFHDDDPMFIVGGSNDLELRILSGAIVHFRVTEHADTEIATLLLTGHLGIDRSTLVNTDIMDDAQKFLDQTATNVRKYKGADLPSFKFPLIKEESPTLENLQEDLKASNSFIKSMVEKVEKTLKTYTNRIEILEEECDIHWWLFRSFCETKGQPVSELNASEAPFLLAAELASKFHHAPVPGNANQFLSKILKDINDIPISYSLIDIVQLLQTTDGLVDGSLAINAGNLLPICFSLAKAQELETVDVWTPIILKQAGIEPATEFQTHTIAHQFFMEIIFIKRHSHA